MSATNFARVFTIFVAMFAITGATSTDTASGTHPTKLKLRVADYARPISFEPNRGQTEKDVDFLAHGAGYSLFLSHGEAVMLLKGGASVRLKPVGANASTQSNALDLQSSKSNYFIGNVPERWHTGIPNYAKVRYGNVYPGVDMIYYGNQRQLEYDFIVSPGSDSKEISLKFEGPGEAELDREGDLVMRTTAGDLRWRKPIAYQEVNGRRTMVTCAYLPRSGQRIGFRLDAYDRTKPLVIDPEVDYSTYLGGTGINGEQGNSIAADAKGSAYVTGSTGSFDFPTRSPFQNTLKNTVENAFVTKFNAAGELVYSTYLGGSGNSHDIFGDQGHGIAVDGNGYAYVTGETGSFDFPVKSAFQRRLKSSFGNAFVTKLCPRGDALVYSTYLGGSGAKGSGDRGLAIALDANGHAYITGDTFSTDFPLKDAFQKKNKGNDDAFVTKLDADGDALVYSTYLGGSELDQGEAIAVDAHGNAYVTGEADSPDFPIKNAFQAHAPSPVNAFVTKLDEDGDALAYSTYLGGSGLNLAYGISVDAKDNAYVTGETTSLDFPTKNAFQRSMKSTVGSSNAFVTKFYREGDGLVYSTYFGGSIGEVGAGIAVDSYGEAYVTGNTGSFDFPTKNAFQPMLGGPNATNAFVAKFDRAGCSLVYSSYLGGSGPEDGGIGIAVDAEGNAYVTGFALSTDFPTKNAFQDKLKSSNGNAFVTKISVR